MRNSPPLTTRGTWHVRLLTVLFPPANVSVESIAPKSITTSSPAPGSTSPLQLAGVLQSKFPPPPSQVTTAGAVRSSSTSAHGLTKAGRRFRGPCDGLREDDTCARQDENHHMK